IGDATALERGPEERHARRSDVGGDDDAVWASGLGENAGFAAGCGADVEHALVRSAAGESWDQLRSLVLDDELIPDLRRKAREAGGTEQRGSRHEPAGRGLHTVLAKDFQEVGRRPIAESNRNLR